MDDKVEFVIEFEEGKIFKDLIESVKQINKTGFFKFTKYSFSYSQYSQENKIWLEVEISTSKLSKYTFDSNSSEYIVELNIKTIKSNLSQVTGKDGVMVYKISGEDNIYFQRISKAANNSKSVCCMSIPKILKERIEYAVPDYDDGNERFPTIITDTSEFKKELGAIVRNNSSLNEIHLTKSTIIFRGINQEKTSTVIAQFESNPPISIAGLDKFGGVTLEPKKDFDIKVEVSKHLLKYLIKICNLSGSGVKAEGKIRIILEEGLPIKLVSNVGIYGIVRSYILTS